MYFLFTDRHMSNLENFETNRPVLSDAQNLYSYKGTSYTDEIDTRFPPDQDDIDARFGASTHIGRSTNSDHTFSSGYQSSGGYKARNGPPKGIFDDV